MSSDTRTGFAGNEAPTDSIRHIAVAGIALHWTVPIGIKLVGTIAFSVGTASPALAQRFSFERSFDVTGPSALDVSTIQEKIEITAGEPGPIVVMGTATFRVDWNVPANAADSRDQREGRSADLDVLERGSRRRRAPDEDHECVYPAVTSTRQREWRRTRVPPAP